MLNLTACWRLYSKISFPLQLRLPYLVKTFKLPWNIKINSKRVILDYLRLELIIHDNDNRQNRMNINYFRAREEGATGPE